MNRPTRSSGGRQGGGGKDMSWLMSLIAGAAPSGEANLANTATTPGEVPYQYKGDPSNAVGKGGFVSPKTGQLTQNAFQTNRWIDSALGRPDIGKQWNTQIQGTPLLDAAAFPGQQKLAQMNADVTRKSAIQQAQDTLPIDLQRHQGYSDIDFNQSKDLNTFLQNLSIQNIPRVDEAGRPGKLALQSGINDLDIKKAGNMLPIKAQEQQTMSDIATQQAKNIANYNLEIAPKEFLARQGLDYGDPTLYPMVKQSWTAQQEAGIAQHAASKAGSDLTRQITEKTGPLQLGTAYSQSATQDELARQRLRNVNSGDFQTANTKASLAPLYSDVGDAIHKNMFTANPGQASMIPRMPGLTQQPAYLRGQITTTEPGSMTYYTDKGIFKDKALIPQGAQIQYEMQGEPKIKGLSTPFIDPSLGNDAGGFEDFGGSRVRPVPKAAPMTPTVTGGGSSNPYAGLPTNIRPSPLTMSLEDRLNNTAASNELARIIQAVTQHNGALDKQVYNDTVSESMAQHKQNDPDPDTMKFGALPFNKKKKKVVPPKSSQ